MLGDHIDNAYDPIAVYNTHFRRHTVGGTFVQRDVVVGQMQGIVDDVRGDKVVSFFLQSGCHRFAFRIWQGLLQCLAQNFVLCLQVYILACQLLVDGAQLEENRDF